MEELLCVERHEMNYDMHNTVPIERKFEEYWESLDGIRKRTVSVPECGE